MTRDYAIYATEQAQKVLVIDSPQKKPQSGQRLPLKLSDLTHT